MIRMTISHIFHNDIIILYYIMYRREMIYICGVLFDHFGSIKRRPCAH